MDGKYGARCTERQNWYVDVIVTSYGRCYVCIVVYDTHVVHRLWPAAVLPIDTCYICIAVYSTHVVHRLWTAGVLPNDTCFLSIAVYDTHVVHRHRRTTVLPIPSTAYSATALASLWTRTHLRCPNCCLLHLIWNILRIWRDRRILQE